MGVSTALVFYHFGTKDDLLAEAFSHAAEKDLQRLDRAAARGADPVGRLQLVVRRYGPTGTARGWRLWIDAWALAQREPHIQKVLRSMDDRWAESFRRIIDDGIADGSFTCSDPESTVRRVSALLDGLSVATLVYRTVSRAQLRVWMAAAVASELGLDATALD